MVVVKLCRTVSKSSISIRMHTDLSVNELRTHEHAWVPFKAFVSGHFVLNVSCNSLRSFTTKRSFHMFIRLIYFGYYHFFYSINVSFWLLLCWFRPPQFNYCLMCLFHTQHFLARPLILLKKLISVAWILILSFLVSVHIHSHSPRLKTDVTIVLYNFNNGLFSLYSLIGLCCIFIESFM